VHALKQFIIGLKTVGAAGDWECLVLPPSIAWERNVPVYTIRQVGETGDATHRCRINCQTDREALAIAQRMADTSLVLQLWRGDELVAGVVAAHVRHLRI